MKSKNSEALLLQAKRPTVLAGSIGALLLLGLSAATLRADSIVIGAGPNGSPQVTVDDFGTRQVVTSFSNNTSDANGVTVAAGDGLIVVGEAGRGVGGGLVRIYNASGMLLQTLHPFVGISVGVTVAVGDGELVVGSGAGAAAQVSVFDDTTFAQLSTFNPFGSNGFTGGVNVAVGGGRLVVGEASGGSQVNLYNDATLPVSGGVVPLKTVNPFGTTFTGGVTVGVGDGLLVTGQASGGSQVNVFDAQTYSSQFTLNPYQSFAGGVSVAVGTGDLVVAAGAGGPSQVIFYDTGTFTLQGSLPLPGAFPGGATVAVIPSFQTWTGASSADWNTSSNWNPTVVPTGSGAQAVFDVSSTAPVVSLSADTEVNSITFTANAAANPYTITINPTITLTISGTGIVNNSGVTQTLETAVNANGDAGALIFTNNASAGAATILNHGGTASLSSSGTTTFNNRSTAGQATITNAPGSNSPGGSTVFNDSATAGSAVIVNQGGNAPFSQGGSTVFNAGDAGAATITANGATDGSAASGGQIIFNGGGAMSATLIANGGTVDSAPGGVIMFNSGLAHDATITINGGGAANAHGGAIFFAGDASGDHATVTVAAGGTFDISGLTTDGTSVGSIAGAGSFYLGGKALTVGISGLSTPVSTTVSGTIADGGQSGGSGGSLVVQGSTSLTLTGQNTYTGATDIENGAILNANAPGALPAPTTDGGSGAARAALIMDQTKGSTGFSTLNLGALQAVASLTGASSSSINLNGNVLTVGNASSGTTTFAGVIADGAGAPGTGGLAIDGAATLILSGFNTYTGPTVVNGGTLQVGNALTAPPVNGVPPPPVGDGNLAGTSGVTVVGGAILATDLRDGSIFGANVFLKEGGFNSSFLNAIQPRTNTLAGVISGPGSLSQSGSGTTILTGLNTYSGATLVSAGVLQIGTSSTAGSIGSTNVVDVSSGGTLTLVNVAGGVFTPDIDNFDGGKGTVNISSANTITLSGLIQNSSGTIALTKNGPGTAIFSQPQSYTGGTTVNGGILEIATDSGGLQGNVVVNQNAALRSNGSTIFGNVMIMPGGAYQPKGATTEVFGDLVLNSGGNLSLRLGSPGIEDSEIVGGHLQLAGTVVLTPQAGFGVGSYPLFDTNGPSLLDLRKVAFQGVPGYSTSLTVTPGNGGGSIVTLVVTNSNLNPTQAWDGSTTAGSGVNGGSGTWGAATTNWTDGTTHSPWASGTAFFTNTAGTVRVGTHLNAQGLTFATSGFNLIPDAPGNVLTLTGPASFITVADQASTATISVPLYVGSKGMLIANGPGTLVLTNSSASVSNEILAVNNIHGSVSVVTGTLQLGTAAIPYYFPNGPQVTLSDGATLTLTNLSSGSLDRDVTAGLAQSGAINVASANAITLSGALLDSTPGQLALTVSGTGTVTLTNPGNTFSGATTISSGTLQIGSATARGSIGPASPVVFTGNGTLSLLSLPVSSVFANSISNGSNGPATILVQTPDDLTLSGSISDAKGGALGFIQQGTGTTTLTGRSSYSGTTTVTSGTLQIGDGSTFGTAIVGSQVNVQGSGILALDLAGTSTFANRVNVGPSAALNTIQSGTTTLASRIAGGGSVNQRGAGTTILAADEVYSGPTTVNGGVLQVGDGHTGNLPASTTVTVSGHGKLALDLADHGVFATEVTLTSAASSLIAQGVGQNEITKLISGVGGFTQNGPGVTFLENRETFTGPTNVNAGKLIVTFLGGLASTMVNVNGGALQVDGRLNSLKVNVGAAATLSGTGLITSAVTLTGNGSINLSGVGDEIDGALTITGGAWLGDSKVIGAVTESGASTSVYTIAGAMGIATLAAGVPQCGQLTITGGQLAGAGALSASLDYRSAASSTFPGAIHDFNQSPAGPASVLMEKSGATLALTGASDYTGGTTVSAGTLQVGDGQTSGVGLAKGSPSINPLGTGPVTVSGKASTLAVDLRDQSAFTSAVTLATSGATVRAIQAGATSFTGNITGSGGFVQAGLGTSVLLNGSGMYTGATSVLSGKLEVDTALASPVVHVSGNGTLTGSGATVTSVTLTGNGAVAFSSPDSAITGGLTVSGGHWEGVGSAATVTVNSGNFSIDGTLTTSSGLTVNGGTLSGIGTLNGNLNYQSKSSSIFAGSIAGSSSVVMSGAHSTLTLRGANTFTGGTKVVAGTLSVTGSLGNTRVSVSRGATLAGTGSIGGDVSISTGALAPSDMGVPGNLTIGGNLSIASSTLNVVLGGAGATAAGNNGLVTVDGNATFKDSFTVNIAAGLGFGAGTYNLLNVSGAVTPGTLTLGSVPAGFDSTQLSLQTSNNGHQIQLVVTGGPTVQYWNPAAGAVINGGAGSWDNLSSSWANSSSMNSAWAGKTALFSAGSGVVTVSGNVNVGNLNFVPGAGDYTIQIPAQQALTVQGSFQNTSGAQVLLESTGGVLIFDGADAGNAVITNRSNGTDASGTIFRAGSNGGTAAVTNIGSKSFLDISGTKNGTKIGSIAGDGVFYLGSNVLTVGGNNLSTTVSGIIADGSAPGSGGSSSTGGNLVKTGSGTLTLTGANTYTGFTQVSSGALQIGDGDTVGTSLQTQSIAVVAGATLTLDLAKGGIFDRSIVDGGTATLSGATTAGTHNDFTVSSVISGRGKLIKNGVNTVTLSGANTYSGGTAINAGALIASSKSATGAGPVGVNAGGTLGGSGTITGPLTLNQGGDIAPGAGASGSPGTTLRGGLLLWNPGGTVVLRLGGTTADALSLSGALTKGTSGAGAFTIEIENPASITPGNFTLATFKKTTFAVSDFILELPGNYTGHLVETSKSLVLDITGGSGMQSHAAFDGDSPGTKTPLSSAPFTPEPAYQGANLQVVSVPEPGAATLLAWAGAALLVRRRRKVSQAR